MSRVLLNLTLGLGVLASVLATTPISKASAFQWDHILLNSAPTATAAAQVQLDYTTQEYAYYGNPVVQTFALWINVLREHLSPSDQVRAVLINSPFYAATAGEKQEYPVDLQYAEDGRFTVDASQLMKGANIFNAKQEIAVVINGEWLKTNSNCSNFEFRFVPYRSR